MKLYRLKKLFAEFEYKCRLVVLLKRCFFVFFMDRVLFKSYRNSKSIESTLISLRNSVYRIEKLLYSRGDSFIKSTLQVKSISNKKLLHILLKGMIFQITYSQFFTKCTLTCFLRTCRVIQPSIDKQKNLLLIRIFHQYS